MDNESIMHKSKYYVLSDYIADDEETSLLLKNSTIIVYLYYPDTLNRYFAYIDKLPDDLPIYVISSNSSACEIILEHIKSKKLQKKIKLIKKENRGRDISALLVVAKGILQKYKIVCFIHDKKPIADYLKNDTEFWIYNLWENTICNSNYIYNVLNIFKMNPDIGLLVPPPPIGEHMKSWYENRWNGNFENVKKLAGRLGLTCNIDKDISPSTLGTVFWCRTEALKKLFEFEWKYEDFDEEPLPCNGTISHAIERILPYVALDMGYETGTIMNTSYIEKLMPLLQEIMTGAFSILSNDLGISTLHEITNYINKKEKIKQFCENNDNLYLYGAGYKSKMCLRFLRMNGYFPKKVLVTKNDKGDKELEGIPISEFNSICNFKSIGIIIATGLKAQKEIIHMLNEKNINNYISFYP